MNRMLLKGTDGHVFMQNKDKSVTFQSVEECLFYTDVDLSGDGEEISYEPERGVYAIFDGKDAIVKDIPNVEYESLLDDIWIFLKRQSAPLYGLTGDALDAAVKSEATKAVYETYGTSITAPVEVDGILYNGGNASARDIQGAVELAKSLGETSVLIAGYDNVARDTSFEDALAIATEIGRVWREAYFTKQAALVALEG